MLGKGRGGLEQVAIDYHQAFELVGHRITSLVPPDSWAMDIFQTFTEETRSLSNMGEWDPIATFKLSKIIKKLNPDIIICHGNRAIRLALKAAKKSAPIVGVAHNYKNKSFHECDAIFCITKHLVDRMHKLGISTNKVFHVPNMVKTAENVKRPELRTPPVIGTMGRFVEKKGFDVFIDSLSILKKDGVEFKALLGGDGPLKGQLEKQIQHCALCEEIKLCGWVENKHSFFNDIDLFIFHQASKIVIDKITDNLSLPIEKVYTNYQQIGNTVSASIPIALKDAFKDGKLHAGDCSMLVGFGVGFSWGGCIVETGDLS